MHTPLRKKRLFLNSLPLIIPILLLGIFALVTINTYVTSQTEQQNAEIAQRVDDTLSQIMSDVNIMSLTFTTNASTINTVKSALISEKTSLESLRYLRLIQANLQAVVNSKPYIESVYIYYTNDYGRFFSTRNGLDNLETTSDSAWFSTFANPYGSLTELRPIRRYAFEDSQDVLTIYRQIPEHNGLIVFNINYQSFAHIIKANLLLPSQSVCITDANGMAIYGTLPEAGTGWVRSSLRNHPSGWTVITSVPGSELYRVPRRLILVTILLVLISFLIGLSITLKNQRRAEKWIYDVNRIFDMVEAGEPVPPAPTTLDEEGQIIHNIIHLFIEQRYLKMQFEQTQYHLRLSQLTALQSQINPHFLFNTLNAIYWQVITLTGGPNEATKMIENLSDIFEYSLSSPKQMVTLETELHYAQCYMDIQQYRYKDKFDVVWDLPDPIPNVTMMKIIFQPILENAIYHGIKEKPDRGRISISVREAQDEIIAIIQDDGIGMTQSRLAEIRESISMNELTDTEHIGLTNTAHRLNLFYGKTDLLTVESVFNRGTVVKIRIPREYMITED